MQVEKFGKRSLLGRSFGFVYLALIVMFGTASWADGTPTPQIIASPVNATAIVGSTGNTASFTVTASEIGSPLPTSTALSFQWQYLGAAGQWITFGTSAGDFSGTGVYSATCISTCSTSGVAGTWSSTFTTNPITTAGMFSPAASGGLPIHVLVTDANNLGVSSDTVFLYANAPPTVTGPASSLTINKGQQAVLGTVSATQNNTGGSLSYQWYKGGTCANGVETGGSLISGATGTTYTISSPIWSDAGTYFTIVKNTYGTNNATSVSSYVCSGTETLTADSPPNITVQPVNDTVGAGADASFSVSAYGTRPLTVTWQYSRNGTTWSTFPSGDISTVTPGLTSGLTTSTMTTTAVAAGADGLQFRAVFSDTNAAGSTLTVPSNPAFLYVIKPPVISSGPTVTSPASGQSYEGGSATLTVAAGLPTETNGCASGACVLSYQWYECTSATSLGSTIIGATSSSLTISSLTQSSAGGYCVAVTNTDSMASGTPSASVTGGPVTLAVTPGLWYAAGELGGVESFERSVLLPNGHVMAIGSDFNDPSDSGDTTSLKINIDTTPGVSPNTTADTWAVSNATLPNPLQRPTATLLPTGVVLIAGGVNETTGLDSVASYLFTENYNVSSDETHGALSATTGLNISSAASLNTARDSHTATLLSTGKVLVTGGYNNGQILNSFELYDPATQVWTEPSAHTISARYRHAATLLLDGTVLVTGGQSTTGSLSALSSAEIYNPVTNTWSAAGTMSTPRVFHTATLLADGTVLITGGINDVGATLQSAEIYYPTYYTGSNGTPGTFMPLSAQMISARNQHTATQLVDGNVLIAGGAATIYQQTSEYYNPTTQSFASVAQSFTQTANLITARDRTFAWLLQNGKVLVEGGSGTGDLSLNTAEKFDDGSGLTPTIPTANIAISQAYITPDGTAPGTATATCGGSSSQPGVTYAWTILNGTIISGQGTYSVTFSANNTPGGIVTLYCLATSSLGIPSSGTYQEPIALALALTVPPVNQNVNAGSDAVFSVSVTGVPTPAITWEYSRNGTTWSLFPSGDGSVVTNTVSGVTTSTLTTNASAADAGGLYFEAIASSTYGNPVTSSAILDVNAAPTVSVAINPSNGLVETGGNVTFTATASGDNNPTYSYVWHGPGGVIGTNSNTLTLTGVTTTATGGYYVVVTNTNTLSGTTATIQFTNSSSTTLTVYTPALIVTSPSSQNILAGGDASFTATASGIPAPTIVWWYSRNGTTWSVFPSGDGSVVSGPITGGTTSTLTTSASAAGADGLSFEAIASNPSATGTTNTSTSSAATLDVNAAPTVSVAINPSNGLVETGGNVTFTATASGDNNPTYSYVWHGPGGAISNGGIFSGATTNALTLTGVTTTATGGYYVVVTNTNTLSGTTATIQFTNSSSTTLTVYTPALIVTSPSSQNIVAGGDASFTATASGIPAPTIVWWYSRNGTTWSVFPSGDGSVVSGPITGGTTSTLTTSASAAGADGLSFEAIASNPSATGTTNTSTSSAATLDVNAAPTVSVAINPSNGLVETGGNVTFTATASGDNNPTYSYVWHGPGGAISNGGIFSGATTNALTLTGVTTTATGGYYVVVTNTNTLSGTTATIQFTNSSSTTLTVYTPALIVTSPSSLSIDPGQTASFTATASGIPAPSIVWWYSRNGTTWSVFPSGDGSVVSGPITGGTTSTLTTSASAAGADGLSFEAIASNPSATGTTNTSTSSVAILTVVGPPTGVSITPSTETVSQGQTATFTASATAAGVGESQSYQWCKGTPSSTCSTSVGTGPTLTISNALLANAGTYYVIAEDVSNQNGSVDSAPPIVSSGAILSVNVGSWTLVGNGSPIVGMDEPRYEAMSVFLPNGTFWTAGGQNNSGLLNDDDIYTSTSTSTEPPTGTWAHSTGTQKTFVAGPHLDGTATLLLGGATPYVLIAGGSNGQDGKEGIEYYNASTQSYFISNETLAQPTTQQVAALLPSQSILLAGGSNGWSDTFYNSAFLFTPGSTPGTGDTLTPSVATLSVARAGSRSVTLDDGRVLIVGGQDVNTIDSNVDIYDTSAANYTNRATVYPTTLYNTASGNLGTGKAGISGDFIAQANCAVTASPTPCMAHPRLYHTATLLSDGRVLIAGGIDNTGTVLSSMEIWNPAANSGAGGFTALGNMQFARMEHSAVLLANGKVLIFGGENGTSTTVNTAEVVDPNYVADSVPLTIPAANMWYNRELDSATLLPNGTVLAAGGYDTGSSATAQSSEIWQALEGYTTAPTAPSAIITVSTSGGNQITVPSEADLTPTSTNTASVPSDPTASYYWKISNGSITAGQNTDQITFTSGTSGSMTIPVLITDIYGFSAVGEAIPTILVPPSGLSLTPSLWSSSGSPLTSPVSITLNAQYTGGTTAFISSSTGGSDIPVTSNNFTTSTLSPNQTTTFTLTVLNGLGGSVTSQVTVYVTSTLPSISSQPSSVAACLNGNASFDVVSSSSAGSLTSYGWYDGATLVGSGTVSGSGPYTYQLTLSGLTAASDGNYTLHMINNAGTTISSPATLKVGNSITQQPQSVTISPSQTATFSVAVSNVDAVSYQWHWIHSSVDTTVGTNSSIYTTPAVTSANNGDQYYVVVSDTGGCGQTALTSSSATLTVNSNYTDVPPTITVQPTGQTAAVGGGATFSATAVGPGSLSYEWYRIPYGQTVGQAYAACGSGGGTGVACTLTVSGSSATNEGDKYYLKVVNGYGQTVSSSAQLAVVPGVLITSQPQTQYVGVGDTAVYSVGAMCNGCTLNYQWYVIPLGSTSASPVSGATSSALEIADALSSQSGSVYYVVVGSSLNSQSVTSQNAGLFVGSLGAVAGTCGNVGNGWQLNYDAVEINETVNTVSTCGIRLVPDSYGAEGSIFWPTPISTAKFSASFTVGITSTTFPADGFTMVLADPTLGASKYSMGAAGGGLGADGIPGFVLGFDTYFNSGTDPCQPPYLGVGQGASNLWENPWTSTNCYLPNGSGTYYGNNGAYTNSSHNYVVTVDNGSMSVTMDGNQVFSGAVSMPPVAYLGFTGSTGGAKEQVVISNMVVTLSADNTPSLLSITVTPAAPTVTIGTTQAFTATGNYSDNTTQNLTSTVTWSDNSGGSGLWTGSTWTAPFLGLATDTITATATGAGVAGATVAGTTTATTALIAQAIASFNPSLTATYGQSSVTLSATGGSSGNPVTFRVVSGPATATGTNGSTLTFTGAGSVVVAADQAGNTNYSLATEVQKTIVVGQEAQAIASFNPSLTATYGQSPVTLSATGGSSGNPVTFRVVSGPATATGTNGSTLTFTGAGSVVVAANQAGNTNYSLATEVQQTIVVGKATPTITWPTASAITYGQTLANSTLSGGSTTPTGGSFAFTTPSTAPGTGTATQSVTYTPADTTDYNTVVSTVSVTVNKANPTVNTWPTASAITYGQTLANSTLSGGSTTPTGGSFAFTTSSTAPGAGTASQSVTYTPADTTNYNTVVSTVSVTVNKANPTVNTWPTASAITAGQTLASSTLTGGSTTPTGGSFAFTTPSTAPGLGTSSQNVTYTPADTTDYNTLTNNVNVTIVAPPPTPTVTVTSSAAVHTAGTVDAYTTGNTASITDSSASSGTDTYSWLVYDGSTIVGSSTGTSIIFTAGASGNADPTCIITNAAGLPGDAGSTSTPINTLSQASLTPKNLYVAETATQQYALTGTYSDTSTANIASGATWSESDADSGAVASIGSSSGLATAGSVTGVATITATINSTPYTTNLMVGAWTASTGTMLYNAYQALPMMELNNGSGNILWVAGGTNSVGDTYIGDSTDALPYVSTNPWTSSVSGCTYVDETWTPCLTYPHLNGTATLVPSGQVIIAGGYEFAESGIDYGIETAIEIYSPTVPAFTISSAALPAATTGQVAALLTNGPNSGDVLFAGGWNDVLTFYTNASLYNPTGSTINGLAADHLTPSSASLGTGRYGSTATTLNDHRILIVGGVDASHVDNAVDIYDSVTTINGESDIYATANASGHFFTTSGATGDAIEQSNCSVSFTPAAGLATPCLNTARTGHTATLLGSGKVLIVGGKSSGGLTGSLEVFDPTLNSGAGGFVTLGTLITARMNHSAVALSNDMVLIFGGTDINGSSLNSAEVVDANWVADGWPSLSVAVASLNIQRTLAASILLPDGTSVLATGGNTGSVSVPADTITPEVFFPATPCGSPTVSLWLSGVEVSTSSILGEYIETSVNQTFTAKLSGSETGITWTFSGGGTDNAGACNQQNCIFEDTGTETNLSNVTANWGSSCSASSAWIRVIADHF
jgi:hypothetical protein